MAITAYKIKGSSDKGAATMIVSGFTGMLKHWWDNYVSDDEKNLIYNATTLEPVARTVNGQETVVQEAQEDACATLLYHIARHFVGEPKLFQDRSLEILNNLRCKNLADFRWYKDTFLIKVMIRPDCNNDFWKERFISGLPPLFADKVRTKLKDRFEGQIPYNILTYGDLVSFITTTGIELCTDLKLKQQLKQNHKYGLTTFCHDYGFTDLNESKRHKKASPRRHKRSYPKRKTSFKEYKESNKPRRKTRRKSSSKSKDTCWTCGKSGHRAKDCTSGKKKKINLLDLPDETKEKLFSIMEDPSEASDSYSSSDDYSDEDYINAAYESDSSQSGQDCECNGTFCTCSRKTLNVITDKPKEILFDIIEHIDDEDLKHKYLQELKRLVLSSDEGTSKPKPIIQPFSMTRVMAKFNSPSEPSIADLRGEISTLKGEIKDLKARLDQVELHVLTEQVLHTASPKALPPTSPNISLPADNLQEPMSFPGEDTSATPSTAVAAIKAYSEHIAVKIVIAKDFVLNKVALFDTGADSNCIVKVLVPTRYLQKSTSKLYSATGEKMRIDYQLRKAHVCNNGVCLINDFVITEDITEDIILGIPFINQIRPYQSDYDGIRTTLMDTEIFFPLLRPLSSHEQQRIKDETVFKINRLSSHLAFLQQDVGVLLVSSICWDIVCRT